MTACGDASHHAAALRARSVLVYAEPATPCCASNPGNRPDHIFVAAPDGRHPRFLDAGQWPTVSPDGRYVAYYRGGKLRVIPTTGGASKTIAPEFEALTWAPNSRFLSFVSYGHIVVVDVATQKQITTIGGHGEIEGYAFSPDSKRVTYTQDYDLYVSPTHGGPAVRLTHTGKTGGPLWGKPGIAFEQSTGPGMGSVWITDPRGLHPRRLTRVAPAIYPEAFSADGTKLLAAYPPFNNGRIWAVDVATGAKRPITPWVGDLHAEGLSEDGRTVLAGVGCGGTPSPYGNIETIPYAGGKPHVIVHGPCFAQWSAG